MKLTEVPLEITDAGRVVCPYVAPGRIARLKPWFHMYQFGDTLVGKSPAAKMIQNVCDGIDFEDKSVTDIGCNSGMATLFADKAGAFHVYPIDIDETWKGQFQLLRELFELTAEWHTQSVYGLTWSCDICLMMGVYYHLLWPHYGIARAWESVLEVMVIEGEIAPVTLYPTLEEPYKGTSTNYWIPSVEALETVLKRLPGVKDIRKIHCESESRAAYQVRR